MNKILDMLADFKKRLEALETAFLRKDVILPDDGTLRPPKIAGDPASPTEGDIWYDTTNHRWRGQKNGSTVTFTTS